ncbi:MAG: bifunctional phosphoribosylaminoimidazolecarboxamide formyltransferase/IMP cyclohydrolase [Methanomicrobiaceae archaeon]|nr:bifunctional phosphoribosylaminoimidazolecarboxamide formyltransferase/IMP cyclohydrolase [Methanomicrobiaceae archaeon]
MKWALLSVWDKEGILELARTLHAQGFGILSSGGTGRALEGAGIPFEEVSSYTGVPEMMEGRVKTLHPLVHGGILGRRGIDDATMVQQGIRQIELVVVNLYPFEKMALKDLSLPELVEYIDIGGPALIRAAAKNYRDVAVVVDPADYPWVEESLRAGGLSEEMRLGLARKAFARTAAYDASISNYLHGLASELPEVFTVQLWNGRILRYGENPHQIGAVYGNRGIAGCESAGGKAMSYNNYLDLDAAASLLAEFDLPCAVIVKHNNPCGVANDQSIGEAYVRAREVDPEAAYGSVVALNREVDPDLATAITSTYVEVVIAPSYHAGSLEILAGKANMRVLTLPPPIREDEIRSISGGALLQRTPEVTEHWKVVTERDPEPREFRALQLAWKVVAHAKSNAIVFADESSVIGIGAGQVSRVDAAKIAVQKARRPLVGSAVASDAFLPFPDTLEVAAEAGATALVQPGGSIRDAEVIEAANRLHMAMVFTGVRHFRH